MLETRQASSDEDMLSTDEMDAPDETTEEYAVNFDLPGEWWPLTPNLWPGVYFLYF